MKIQLKIISTFKHFSLIIVQYDFFCVVCFSSRTKSQIFMYIKKSVRNTWIYITRAFHITCIVFYRYIYYIAWSWALVPRYHWSYRPHIFVGGSSAASSFRIFFRSFFFAFIFFSFFFRDSALFLPGSLILKELYLVYKNIYMYITGLKCAVGKVNCREFWGLAMRVHDDDVQKGEWAAERKRARGPRKRVFEGARS